jgi:hypothetical protein
MQQIPDPTALQSTHQRHNPGEPAEAKIEDDVAQPKYTLTETGIGYRLRPPD